MLWALFFNAFLAASLWPLGVEPLYIYTLGQFNPWLCLLIAGAGNSLGAIFTFCMARYFPGRNSLLNRLGGKSKHFQKIMLKVEIFGPYTALLCWLPIVGDVIALALGFSKSSAPKSFLFMTIGKYVRFAIINIIYLNLI